VHSKTRSCIDFQNNTTVFLLMVVSFGHDISTPHTSSPMTLEMRSARKIFSGIISVTSTDVPPVLKFAVDLYNFINFRMFAKV
jgi:hypothetical protein